MSSSFQFCANIFPVAAFLPASFEGFTSRKGSAGHSCPWISRKWTRLRGLLASPFAHCVLVLPCVSCLGPSSFLPALPSYQLPTYVSSRNLPKFLRGVSNYVMNIQVSRMQIKTVDGRKIDLKKKEKKKRWCLSQRVQ